MTTAWRQFWIVGLIALAGCGRSEPVLFSHDVRFTSDQATIAENIAAKPNARRAADAVIDGMFGDSPYRLRVPEGAGFLEGGRYLAGLVREGAEEGQEGEVLPVVFFPRGSDRPTPVVGGQALYHRHCLHCHGVSGDGQGPTAAFLYPRPRDYRRGLFKFTATDYGSRPSREDLRRTLHEGIDGTSMPAFGAQMTEAEIEQVIDYVIFLSMRGEVLRLATEEASYLDDADLDELEEIDLFREEIRDIATGEIFASWNRALAAETIVRPLSPRVPSSFESIGRGRDLFLGRTRERLECAGCHGTQGKGDGPSWIDPETFNRYVFRENYDPTDPKTITKLREVAEQQQRRWGDDWEDPLRPADLNKGVYKGGRRPIDLYWRIATGITGTPMPAHAQTLSDPDDLWHLVNFVMALPRQPELLRPDQLRRLGVVGSPEAAATASR